MRSAVESVAYIADHLRNQQDDDQVCAHFKHYVQEETDFVSQCSVNQHIVIALIAISISVYEKSKKMYNRRFFF